MPSDLLSAAHPLRKASPAAKTAKTHYVIVDAIGVTKSLMLEQS